MTKWIEEFYIGNSTSSLIYGIANEQIKLFLSILTAEPK